MNHINSEKYKRIILIASIALFISSLTQKCYCTTNQYGDSTAALLAGWLGIGFGGAALAWLANPLLWISWIFMKRIPKLSLIFSIMSSLVCLSFLLFRTAIDDEAGHYNKIISYKMGYWLWLASPLVMLAGNLILRASKQKVVIKL